MKLYVGNLLFGVTKEELQELFSPFGEISSVELITDRYSGKSRGFGFVEFPQDSEAEAAIRELNDKDYKGRLLKVNQAQERDAVRRPPRNGNKRF